MRAQWIHVFVASVALLAAAGCKSNPYCLNCGDLAPGDLQPVQLDLAGPVDMTAQDLTTPPDLTVLNADGGPCIPSNGGIEICDGIDNDCNGVTDDVSKDKLVGDPNNCGACGNVCNFNAQHQFGACQGGFDGGTPTCVATTCQPGYVMLPGHTSCDYACTPTSPPTEVCDGKDNDCNGKIDDPFTNSWDATGTPLYDKDASNCGTCGNVCNYIGAVATCKKDAVTGAGVCGVDHCVNDGTNTYRHDPTNPQPRDVTGCEVHCPFASTTTTSGSNDCDNTSCSFPPELCNGLDDNCNFKIDDAPFAASEGIGSACGATCPGGLVANCKGQCQAGVVTCSGGVKQCVSPPGSGPSPETCDGKDNDCDGLVDDPFTAAAPGGYSDGNAGQKPLYNRDPNNCGACGGSCTNLKNAVAGCEPDGTNGNKGMCYVVSCNSGYNYPTCGTSPGPENGALGVGCSYKCPMSPTSPETCDGVDNDCNGCVDDGLTQPTPFCANQGVCGTATIKNDCSATANCIRFWCDGTNGWSCDYSKVTNINLTGTNLSVLESSCDTFDNNCNGVADKDGFPTLGNSCSVGTGICQNSGTIACDLNSADATYKKSACMSGGAVVTASAFKARDESCNGKDDDCDGVVDERTPKAGTSCYTDNSGGGSHACKGWVDPMVHVVSGTTDQWVYSYEASRPDATSSSQGGNSSRACANASVLPWSNVTETQAELACEAVKDSTGAPMHLCSQPDWQNACEGTGSPLPSGSNVYSYSSSNASYTKNVCNDVNSTWSVSSPVVWPTGHDSGLTQKCYTPWTGGNLHDMSGNLMEWTSTTLAMPYDGYYKIRGGAFTSPSDGTPPDGTSCEFDFVIAKPDFANSDIGFRCCATNAP